MQQAHAPDQAIIRQHLAQTYAIEACTIEQIERGNDPQAALYLVQTSEQQYFLKLKHGSIYQAGVLLPRYLKDRGVAAVVAPVDTRTQQLWGRCQQFHSVLYPYIEGATGMDHGMSAQQWQSFGQQLSRIHTMQVRPPLRHMLRWENFRPPWLPTVQAIQQSINTWPIGDSYSAELIDFWRVKTREISYVIERISELGNYLRVNARDFGLSHGDIHTANIVLDQIQQINIVDWDYPLFAPKERDLRFVVGSVIGVPVQRHEEQWFFEGYGQPTIDYKALAYYRYERVIQDLGDYAQRVLLRRDAPQTIKQAALQSLRSRFLAGNIIESAYQADRAR
ncbi:aminoglycoside phosphotransferase family protein [Herpetosiphon giganteus]|uniref:aminoglycoside phosphotransferase family protein n=1 Tax=Herpetosiphon giganteus TaxID=2029754 RepID=UPI00195C99BE|nr:aminoglycoside phosphotransferase family protein [Herpetosiphon giganteus]MBM7845021.1 spectinomycin phosphotransferase [Herpetosiphon giganteus]